MKSKNLNWVNLVKFKEARLLWVHSKSSILVMSYDRSDDIWADDPPKNNYDSDYIDDICSVYSMWRPNYVNILQN